MPAQKLLMAIERRLLESNDTPRLVGAGEEHVTDAATLPEPAPPADAPHMTPGQAYGVILDWSACIGAFLVALLGGAVVVGWFLDIKILKSVLPGLATMKMNTALGLVACGVSLGLLRTAVPGSWLSYFARALAVMVALLGVLTLAEDIFHISFGIDQLIVRDDFLAVDTPTPGRMSPATAFNFFILGIALLALQARRPRLAACTHWLVAPPLFIATLAIVGYAYGVSGLYQVWLFTSMALHTAVAFFVLALAVLAADSRHGFARIAVSDTVGGLVSRWLLPIIPLMLFALGWVRLKGEEVGLYEFHFGLALMVLLSIAVCVIAVAWTAIVLHRIDLTRLSAEAELRSLNVDLERRVKERTKELSRMSEQLSAANKSLEQLSRQDGLTNLANRRYFDRYLGKRIAVARRNKRSLALVLCDVDAFKAYNDHYGHQAGDECLKQVAAAIATSCRRPSDMAARYGGEEFALVLPDTDLDGAIKIAELAREAVEHLKVRHAHSPAAPHVSISGGVAAMLIDEDATAEQLIAAADGSLYEAKNGGRNRTVPAQAEAA
jgi:diguanylate cyclase (GGDEF)-like protein